MKLRAISLGLCGVLAAGVGIVQIVSAQNQRFAAETRTFTDVVSALNGTWKLKQRTNPDGTPYRSKLEGITYISIRRKTGDALGPHAVATLYAKESGVADTHFFEYPPDVAGKAFQVESSGTWLVHNIQNTANGAEISARVFTMAKGTLPPYTDGLIVPADVRYNVSRTAPREGAAAVPRLEFASLRPGELTDFAGKRIEPTAMVTACCGMTSLVVTQNTMEIGWSNKGKDTWVKSSGSVPSTYR